MSLFFNFSAGNPRRRAGNGWLLESGNGFWALESGGFWGFE